MTEQPAALVGLTLPASDADAAQRWWQEVAGLRPDEDGVLAIGDVEVRFGERLVLTAVGRVEGPVAREDPAGTRLEVVPPDTEAAERAEASIRDFVVSADGLAGPPVELLVEQVAELVRASAEQAAALLADVPHDKVLAVQLGLGQRARQTTDEDQWPLHAASTLLSGLVIRGASR